MHSPRKELFVEVLLGNPGFLSFWFFFFFTLLQAFSGALIDSS